MPNRERPLSELGFAQAKALIPILDPLDLTSLYASPFLRALQTVKPYCDSHGINPIEQEAFRESTNEEPISEVKDRMMGAIVDIVESEPDARTLICTHGGCTWGVITQFKPSFDYEDYQTIRTPDLFRISFENGTPRLDEDFSIPNLT